MIDRIRSFFRGRGRPLGAALSLIPAALAALMSLYYIWGPGQGYFHSDCSDSLYWANATVEAGEVFDDTFRYAGMLPFSVSAIFVPLIRLFGVGEQIGFVRHAFEIRSVKVHEVFGIVREPRRIRISVRGAQEYRRQKGRDENKR